MQAAQNFFHNDVKYKKYDKVVLKNTAELKELKAKGIIADKVARPKVKKEETTE